MDDVSATILIDKELAAEVEIAAASKGIPVKMYVEDAVASYLCAEMKWSHDPDPAIDEAIAEQARIDGDTIPAEDIVAWMRSWFTTDELSTPIPS